MNFSNLIMKPSAFIPVALSLTALALVVGHIAVFGIVREADEGTAAHIFQLLMVAEIPFILFFAGNWLPRFPKPAIQVLAFQAIAGLAALAPVFIFKL
ncbi:MAG TPA: hypothetical protein VGK00_15490 [Anaerolineales bacterium]|jgi:hypothetical protein